MMFNKEKLGISYGRVSTINQLLGDNGQFREDASPVAQKSRCELHAQYLSQKTGYEYKLIKHFSDEGFSAKNVNRPEYQKMWGMIASGKISFVISSELSRLSRSVVDFLDLVSHCQKHQVDLIIIGLDLDTSTPFGRVIVVILVALAQFEREMTSMRVKENALNRLLSDGKINGANEVLGLDRDPNRAGHYIRNEDEIKRIETIYKLFLELSNRNLVLEKLNELGIMNKNGEPFKKYSLASVLWNSKLRYRGIWEANKENKELNQECLPDHKKYQIVKLPHGPLLEIPLLDAVAKKMEKIKENTRRHPYKSCKNYIYLLSGILIYEDGSFFNGESTKKGKYRYYINLTQRIRVECSHLDKMIIEHVKKFFAENDTMKELLMQGLRGLQQSLKEINRNIKTLEEQVAQVQAEENTLMGNFSEEQNTQVVYSEWLKTQLKNVQDQKEKLMVLLESAKEKKIKDTKKVTNMKKEVSQSLENYIHLGLELLSRPTLRSLVEKVIHQITIKSDSQVEIAMAI